MTHNETMPNRIVWITDPHLNHVPVQAWDQMISQVVQNNPDSIVITGDISEGDDVVFQLNRIAEAIAVPIHFVLGNHDFYHSSIAKTRRDVVDAARSNPLLNFLTDSGPIQFADDVFLIGDDGWGDATAGDYENSPVRLNDFARIEDFYLRHPKHWKEMLIQQGVASASRLNEKLNSLPETTRHVIVATHVPPFCESCWYEGKTTDENWAPFFVCGQVGEVLKRASQSNTKRQHTVLCGHTHHDGIANISDNLIVYTGAAQYGKPGVEGVVMVQDGEMEVILSVDQRKEL